MQQHQLMKELVAFELVVVARVVTDVMDVACRGEVEDTWHSIGDVEISRAATVEGRLVSLSGNPVGTGFEVQDWSL